MAADVKAPRIVRSTTNMEDAAKVAAARGGESHLSRVIVRKILPNGAEPNFANVLRVVEDLDRAWDAWAEPDPVKALLQPSEAVWRAGYEAIGDARWRANCVLRSTPAVTVAELAAKTKYILHEVLDSTDDPYLTEGLQSILHDVGEILRRPDGDAFAILLRNWERSWEDRDAYDKANRPEPTKGAGITPEIQTWEEGRGPFNDATEAAALALLRCPAPDIAALNEKRRVFLAEEMHTCAYASSELVEVLFDEAIRLAGGAA